MHYNNRNLDKPNLIVNAFAEYFNCVYVLSKSCTKCTKADDFSISDSDWVTLPQISRFNCLKEREKYNHDGSDGSSQFFAERLCHSFHPAIVISIQPDNKKSTFPTM